MASIFDQLRAQPPPTTPEPAPSRPPPGTPLGERVLWMVVDRAMRHLAGRIAPPLAVPSWTPPAWLTMPAPILALGIRRWPCTKGDVRAAYERIALERHPDRGNGAPFDGDALRRLRDQAMAEVDRLRKR